MALCPVISIRATGSIAAKDGNAYVVGTTFSDNFVVTDDAFIDEPLFLLNGVGSHAFMTKLDAEGEVTYSTYFARLHFGEEEWNGHVIQYTTTQFTAYSVQLDALGRIYLAGGSAGLQQGDLGAPDDLGHVMDAFVGRFSAAGLYEGGNFEIGGIEGAEVARGMAVHEVDEEYRIHLAGWTTSSDFPTVNAFDSTLGGPRDVFAMTLPGPTAQPLDSTFLGGAGDDAAWGLAIDCHGNIYLTGGTNSTDFPTTPGVLSVTLTGPDDAFVAKFDEEGGLEYSTYLGAGGSETARAISVNMVGGVAVVGETTSADWTMVNAFQPVFGGLTDGFLVQLAPDFQAVDLSTFLGGMNSDGANAIDYPDWPCGSDGTDPSVTGSTNSPDFPVEDPLQTYHPGGYDAYITRPQGAYVDLVIHKPKVIDTGEPEIPNDIELTKGSQTFVNLDNDDADSLFDNVDSSIPGGDDELVKIKLKVPTSLDQAGTVVLNVPQGSGDISIWKSNTTFTEAMRYTPGTPIPLNDFTVEGSFRVYTMWVNGSVASTVQQRVHLELVYQHGMTEHKDKAALTVIGIESIDWVGRGNSATNTNVLDADPNFPAYLAPTAVRVFPDARIVGNLVEAGPRDVVDAAVTLSVKPIEPLLLYFRSFDVDDPSAEAGPVDDPRPPNIWPTNEWLPEDNRGGTAAIPKAGLLTNVNANGGRLFTEQAETLAFQVTMQPGDNFKIVGNGDKDFLPHLTNDDFYINYGATPEIRNLYKQHIYFKYYSDPTTSHYIGINDPDRYASKALTVWRFLHIERDQMTPPAPGEGGPFDEDGAGFDDPRPTAEDLATPPIQLLPPHYAQAYIQVVDDLAALNVRPSLAFFHYLTAATIDVIGNTIRDVPSLQRFWVIQLVSAYEYTAPGQNRDYDPNDITSIPQLAYASPVNDGSCLVFIETIRDFAANGPRPPLEIERALFLVCAAYHETVHRFGLYHTEIGGDEGPLNVLNNFKLNESLNDLSTEQLNVVRSALQPQ